MLFHITASPAWSSLPLSGLYVDMLKRLLALVGAARRRATWRGLTSLPPVSLLDGFGHPSRTPGDVAAHSRRGISPIPAFRPQHPPGLYGAQGVESALERDCAPMTG